MGTELRSPGRIGTPPLVRIAAVGDLHVGLELSGEIRRSFLGLSEKADLLLIAGDLTQHGEQQEAQRLAEELAEIEVPVLAVLGNHDHHADQADAIRRTLEAAHVILLEGEACTLEVGALRLGIAGTKGFGGGFIGASGSEFGEPVMKEFIRHTKQLTEGLNLALESVAGCDVRVALLHYAPAEGTLHGERLEIYPFLGSYMMGEVIDRHGCTLAIHGHAHRGAERCITPGGVPVRNVARPVIQRAYKVFEISRSRTDREIYDHRTMV